MVSEVVIGTHRIGDGSDCFIIAEAGVNHNGSAAMADDLIDAAARSGANAVKFQTFDAEQLAAESAQKASYQVATTGAGESQLTMLRRLELHPDQHRRLAARAAERQLTFLSTPFDEGSADFLESLGVAAFKIPSGELTNLAFVSHVAKKRRPMIVSTGMATLEEVHAAVDAIRAAGDPPLVLLHCVSQYPTPPQHANLRAIETLRDEFRVPVGFSDHTEGIDIAIAAAARGAAVIEKHFTIDRSQPGPDHAISLEPGELTRMVATIRLVQSALGDGIKRPTRDEADTAAAARRSIIAARDIAAGTVIDRSLVAFKRPGTGLPPARLAELIGRPAKRDIAAAAPLTMDMFE